MASKTEICNLALSHLGVSKPIANIDTEKTNEAASCRTFFDITRDRLFRDHPFPFAQQVVDLGLVEENPTDEWAFSFRFPVQAIALRKILSGVRNDSAKGKVKYDLGHDATGKLIWTDLNPAKALIITALSNPQLYPPDLTMAFSFLLASYIAPRVMDGDPAQLGQLAFTRYTSEISTARAASYNEVAHDLVPESEFIRSRDGLEDDESLDGFKTGL